MKSLFCIVVCVFMCGSTVALATDNYQYGEDEYATISKGMSPNGKYAVTAHGGGEDGYDHFHLFLTNAVTGKKIGPLEEIGGGLDTGADAYAAKWSKDSQQMVIVYRIDRHQPLQAIFYRVAKGRAFLMKGPADASEAQTSYWGKYGSGTERGHGKTFGTPKKLDSVAQ